jgi:hypothetical protein
LFSGFTKPELVTKSEKGENITTLGAARKAIESAFLKIELQRCLALAIVETAFGRSPTAPLLSKCRAELTRVEGPR